MAGKESGNAAAGPAPAQGGAADAPAAPAQGGAADASAAPAQGGAADAPAAAQERTHVNVNVMPPEEVEYRLSLDYSKPLPRHDDDDHHHNPYKDEWNDGVDFFNELRRHHAAEQAVLRAEYMIKGCIDLGHDQVARRSQLSHQVYLDTKPAGADDDHVDFIEKLYRGQEDSDE